MWKDATYAQLLNKQDLTIGRAKSLEVAVIAL